MTQQRGPDGKFLRPGAEPQPRGRVPVAVRDELGRRLRHGMRVLAAEQPEFSRALDRRARDLIGGVEGGHRLFPLLQAEARTLARSEALLEALDAYVLALGSRVINGRYRRAYPILADRAALATQVGTSRERLAKLLSAADLEARLAAIEARQKGGMTVDVRRVR